MPAWGWPIPSSHFCNFHSPKCHSSTVIITNATIFTYSDCTLVPTSFLLEFCIFSKCIKLSIDVLDPWVVWSSTLSWSLRFQFQNWFLFVEIFLFDEIYVDGQRYHQPLEREKEEFLESESKQIHNLSRTSMEHTLHTSMVHTRLILTIALWVCLDCPQSLYHSFLRKSHNQAWLVRFAGQILWQSFVQMLSLCLWFSSFYCVISCLFSYP